MQDIPAQVTTGNLITVTTTLVIGLSVLAGIMQTYFKLRIEILKNNIDLSKGNKLCQDQLVEALSAIHKLQQRNETKDAVSNDLTK